MDLRAKIEANMLQHSLLARGASVLVGVSGGVDSMVLLYAMHGLGTWKITVAHLNHSLRGAESEADEVFVQSAAKALSLPFITELAEVKSYAIEQGISIEMAGRDLRHRFLMETAGRLNIERIALAHHADDQVETFWLRLLRGDVGPGLAGIRWRRTAGRGIMFIRPLLDVPKAELIHFARENGISFREDASNLSLDFVRNQLRLQVLPQLRNFQPALDDVTLRTMEVFRGEKQFLEEQAREWCANKKNAFTELNVALQREIVRVQLVDLGMRPNFELIESLRSFPGRPNSISNEQTVSRSPSGEVSVKSKRLLQFSGERLEIDLSPGGQVSFGGFAFHWEFVSSPGEASPEVEYYDADRIGGSATLRCWNAGDRFQPIGMPAESKVQDLFTNLQVPPDEKRRRLLGEDEGGKIFWVEGLRISERHKITLGTRSILRWSWRKAIA